MNEYDVLVPIVGYVCVTVKADDKKEAIEKALDKCCNFEDDAVEICELYGTEVVCKGNMVDHPLFEVEVDEK